MDTVKSEPIVFFRREKQARRGAGGPRYRDPTFPEGFRISYRSLLYRDVCNTHIGFRTFQKGWVR